MLYKIWRLALPCILELSVSGFREKNGSVDGRDRRVAPQSGSGCWTAFAARTLNINDTESTKFHATRGLNAAGTWRH